MASFTQNLSGDSRYSITLAVIEIPTTSGASYDIQNNTSDIYYELTATKTSGSGYWDNDANNPVRVTINGSTVVDINVSYDFRGSTPKTLFLAGGNVRGIKHNDDGSKKIAVSAYFSADSLGSATVGGEVTLTTIPRASTVACSSPYIGDTAIITIDKKVESFTHNVTYHIGELTGTIAENTSEKVLSLDTSALKEQIYALMPDAKEIAATIRCRTYNGDTKIGDTQVANFSLYAKESECRPDVSGTVVDTNEATANFGKLVKYLSKPKVTIEATPKYSATIKSYSINLNDGQTSDLQEETFESIRSNNITVNATDSRGYSNPQTIELEMIDYVKLHIDNIDISRTEDVSNEVILNANGVWFNGSFNEENINSLTASFQYKLSDSTEWTDGGTITPTISGNTFTFTDVSLGNIFDYNNEYQFKIVVSDLLMTVGSENKEAITVPKGQEVVAIGEDTVWVYGDLLLNDENILDKFSNTYSTEEQVIGKYKDGKTIYRKVIIGNLTGTYVENGKTFTWIEIGTTIDKLIRLDLDFEANNDYKYITSTNNDLTVSIRYKNQIQIGVNSNVSNGQEIEFILEYTKTTD